MTTTTPAGDVKVRLFAGAAEAAGATELKAEAATLGELIERIVEAAVLSGADSPGGAEVRSVLGRCSFLVAGARTDDLSTPLTTGSSVDVLPPFAGG